MQSVLISEEESTIIWKQQWCQRPSKQHRAVYRWKSFTLNHHWFMKDNESTAFGSQACNRSYCRRVIRQNWNTWSKAETQEKALSIPIFIFFQFQQPFAKSEDFATSSKTLCPLKRKCHLLIPCDGYWIQEVLVKDSAGPSTHSDDCFDTNLFPKIDPV